MNANHYQREALRTDPLHGQLIKEYTIFDPERFTATCRLMQGLMGLCGESGEALDILKKVIFQGHELDRQHLASELGDVAWYLAVSADALGFSLNEIFRMNIEKLRKRYPEGFDSERSKEREPGDL